jgi:hypothetical protein
VKAKFAAAGDEAVGPVAYFAVGAAFVGNHVGRVEAH